MSDVDRLFREGEVHQLCEAINKLGKEVSTQCIAISQKLDRTTDHLEKALESASDKLSDAVQTASNASAAHAKSLVCATWALVGVTVLLLIVTGIHAYIAGTHP